MKYRVDLTSTANVSTSVEIEADSPEAAEERAIDQAREGKVEWGYDGCEDENIEAVVVKELQ